MSGIINGSLIVVTILLPVVILYVSGYFVRKVSCVLHKKCNCNKTRVVTLTANC